MCGLNEEFLRLCTVVEGAVLSIEADEPTVEIFIVLDSLSFKVIAISMDERTPAYLLPYSCYKAVEFTNVSL